MMVKSKVYRGIEFIQLSELPGDQKEMLSNTFNKSLVIKILVSGKVLNDCIQFRDYMTWYEGVFKLQNTPAKIEIPKAKQTSPSEQSLVEN
jgi:hypothetical protein